MTQTIILGFSSLHSLSLTDTYSFLSNFDATFVTTTQIQTFIDSLADEDEALAKVSHDLQDESGLVQVSDVNQSASKSVPGLSSLEQDALEFAEDNGAGYCTDDTDTLRSHYEFDNFDAPILSTPVLLAHLIAEDEEVEDDEVEEVIKKLDGEEVDSAYVPSSTPSTPIPPEDTTNTAELVQKLYSLESSLKTVSEEDPEDDADAESIVRSEDVEEVSDIFGSNQKPGWALVEKMVRCGKDRCNSCPHGPYLYLVRRLGPDEHQWEYLGRVGTVDLSPYNITNIE